VPSTTINPALGAYGHIFNDDAWQNMGQSLHWRTDHGMPVVSRRKQICTPKVAKVPGPCSSDLRSMYKPSFITEDGNHTSKGEQCWWHAHNRAIDDLQLCTAFEAASTSDALGRFSRR